jgi:hypothetical protein
MFVSPVVRCVAQSHRALCEGVSALASRVQADRELTNLIRRKFAIKCTTGGQVGTWLKTAATIMMQAAACLYMHVVHGRERLVA